MLKSSVATFTDPCAYQDAVRSAHVEVLVTARGDFRADLTRIELAKLSLQSGEETLPRVGRGGINARRNAIYFLVGTGQSSGVHSGVELSPGEIVVNAAGSTYHHMTSANCRWGDVSLSSEDLAAAGSALAGRDLIRSDSPQILRPRPAVMSRLIHLHGAAESLAKTAPDSYRDRGCSVVGASFDACNSRVLDRRRSQSRLRGWFVPSEDARAVRRASRRETQCALVSWGYLRRHRRAGAHVARLLPATSRHGSDPLSLAATDASGPTSASDGRCGVNHRDCDRHRPGLLGTWQVLRGVSFAIRGIAFSDPAPPTG